MDDNELTPTQICNIISGNVDRVLSEMGEIVVVGDVDKLYDNSDKSGWVYFSLIDREGGRIRVTVPPEVVRSAEEDIYRQLSRAKVVGRLKYYKPSDRVPTIEVMAGFVSDAGRGEFQIKLDKLMKELELSGLLAKARARKVRTEPPPANVAIIAPKGSRAPEDIRVAATGEKPFGMTLYLHSMNDYSVGSLILALEECRRRDNLDAIIITRGGGEDLSIYDDGHFIVEVAGCRIPVISAIGHASDRTILDYIAAETKPTPTAAGAWLRELHENYLRTRKGRFQNVLYVLACLGVAGVVAIIIWLIAQLG